MKFEKFLKNCGARGTVITTECDGQFLKLGPVMLAIPAGVNVLSSTSAQAPQYIENILVDFDDGYLGAAELTDAKLPLPDASPSKIKRIFSNSSGGTIEIDNKTFAVIERSDHVYTYTEEHSDSETQSALVVSSGFGEEETISAIILDEQYYYNKLTNKEDK